MAKKGLSAYLDDDPLISFDDDDPPQYTAQIDRSKTPYNPATGENYGDNPALHDLIERPKPGIRSAKMFDDAPWKLGQPIDPAKVMQPLSSDSQSGAQGVPYYLDKPFTGATAYFDADNPAPADKQSGNGWSGDTQFFDPDNPTPPDPSTAPPPPPAAGLAPAPRTATNKAVDPSALFSSYDALKTAVLAAPKLTPPKPWQRIVSGALGGLAGWSNAASRSRTPIDIDSMSQGILHPRYAENMAAYKAKLAPLEQATQLEGQRYAAQEQAARGEATMDELRARADYYRGLGRNDNVTVTPEMSSLTNGVFHAGTVISSQLAQKIYDDAHKAKVDKATRVAVTPLEKFKELKEAFGHIKSDEDLWQAVVNPSQVGKPETKDRNLSPVDVLLHPWDFDKQTVANAQRVFNQEHRGDNAMAEELRQQREARARSDDQDRIIRDKLTQENTVNQQRQQAITQVTSNVQLSTPDRKAERAQLIADINNKARTQLQNIQDNYARAWRQRGLEADDYDITLGPNGEPVSSKRVAMAKPNQSGPGPWAGGYVAPAQAAAPPPQPATGVKPSAGREITPPQEITSHLVEGVPRKVNTPTGVITIIKRGGKVYQQ